MVVDSSDEERSATSRGKKNYSLSSKVLRERQLEVQKALLNECLHHYEKSIMALPVERRPCFDPLKEQVWPSFFDLDGVPAVPLTGVIPSRPAVKKASSLADYLRDKNEHSDKMLREAMEKAADRTSLKTPPKALVLPSSGSQSSRHVRPPQPVKKQGPLILSSRSKNRMQQRQPRSLIRDPTITSPTPKKNAFMEIDSEKGSRGEMSS